jgi:hypothetical protein
MIDSLEGVFAYIDDSPAGSPDRLTRLLLVEVFQRFGCQWSRHQP